MKIKFNGSEPSAIETQSIGAAESFSHCPNRLLELQKNSSYTYDLTCPKFSDGTTVYHLDITKKPSIESAAEILGCKGCPYGKTAVKKEERVAKVVDLHPEVVENTVSLFDNEHYPQAVQNGWLTVRTELRALSGHERASDAFGSDKIDIASDLADNLKDDVQQGAKFLMMAIDRFRNVGAHSTEGMSALFPETSGSQVASEFLAVASLAMRLLDRSKNN
jgi:uncharacterized protein (TIGR02391 family)